MKIKTRNELKEVFSKNRPKIIGFTSGSFDILHPGHVDYLEKAKQQCDCLVVAVNSDASIKGYKSTLRPIVPAKDRARVVAGLEAVDYVFIFDELNNQKNIPELKPNIYFKAGDYDISQLSSAPLIESYGGRVILIPVVEETSTTGVINSVLEKYTAKIQAYIPKEKPEKRPALFLDRDGTIIKHYNYLFDPDLVELLPGATEGIKKFQDDGYRIVIITNQPGLDFGYFEYEKMFKVNKQMLTFLSQEGVLVDKIYFSPYTKAAGTQCRKPGTALVERAVAELNLDLSKSLMIGDTAADIGMAKNAGIESALVVKLEGEEVDYQSDSILDVYRQYVS